MAEGSASGGSSSAAGIYAGPGSAPAAGDPYPGLNGNKVLINGTITTGKGQAEEGDANKIIFNVTELEISETAVITAVSGLKKPSSGDPPPGIIGYTQSTSLISICTGATVESDVGNTIRSVFTGP
jgi:hypothetical protein